MLKPIVLYVVPERADLLLRLARWLASTAHDEPFRG